MFSSLLLLIKLKCQRLQFLRTDSSVSNSDAQNLLNGSYLVDRDILLAKVCSSVNGLQVLSLNPLFFYYVPIWIKLGRIPMELWTDVRLTVVASVIGKPLSLDLATKERRRLSHA